MADNEQEETSENQEEGQAEKKGGINLKKLILLGGLGLVVIGLSVGGTLMVLKMIQPPPEEDMAETEPAEPPKLPAIYFPLKPAILVNFNVKGRQRFLQAELTVMTRDESIIGPIELHMPMIRNALILLIGGQVFAELQTAEGKELLRQQCLQEVQRLLEQETGKPGIEQILFSNFILQ